MPPPTVSQRLRAKLKRLLRERGYGSASELARYSHSKGGARISPQEVTYFLQETPGRIGIKLDDLGDLAGFLRVSIGELLGDTRLGDLTGDEQRVIYAFRVLPPATQEHFLALIEAAALGADLAKRKPVMPRRVVPQGVHPHAAASVLARSPAVRALIERFNDDLAAVFSHAPEPGGQTPTADPRSPRVRADSRIDGRRDAPQD